MNGGACGVPSSSSCNGRWQVGHRLPVVGECTSSPFSWRWAFVLSWISLFRRLNNTTFPSEFCLLHQPTAFEGGDGNIQYDTPSCSRVRHYSQLISSIVRWCIRHVGRRVNSSVPPSFDDPADRWRSWFLDGIPGISKFSTRISWNNSLIWSAFHGTAYNKRHFWLAGLSPSQIFFLNQKEVNSFSSTDSRKCEYHQLKCNYMEETIISITKYTNENEEDIQRLTSTTTHQLLQQILITCHIGR